MPLPPLPALPSSPPTLKTDSGWARRSQAFRVVSFTGEHSALGYPWDQKTAVSPQAATPTQSGIGEGGYLRSGCEYPKSPSSQSKELDSGVRQMAERTGTLESNGPGCKSQGWGSVFSSPKWEHCENQMM